MLGNVDTKVWTHINIPPYRKIYITKLTEQTKAASCKKKNARKDLAWILSMEHAK